MTSWGVVATVDEPPELIAAFAAYHVAIGAREVRLYFDTPNPEARALLAHIPEVIITECDDAYWAASPKGQRFPRQTNRQMVNANHAYERANVTWLLHSDADEYVRDGAALTQALGEISPEADVVRLLVLERLRRPHDPGAHLFEGVFRRWDREHGQRKDEIYGRYTKFLNLGMAGHRIGKSLARTGRGLDMQVHIHAQENGERVVLAPRIPGLLLHFDGMTRLHFLLKMLKRNAYKHYSQGQNPDGNERGHQARFVLNNATKPKPLERFADGLQGATNAQLAQLKALDLVIDAPFDPRPDIAKMGVEIDLTPARFDARLLEKDAKVISDYGFSYRGLAP
ncbi:MAG: glycosyltransferase family 2 protein [Maritimibacter sp.]